MMTVFEPETLKEIAAGAIGIEGEAMVDHVRAELHKAYPGHIFPDSGWILSNAGGCMYVFTPFHASISEYLLIFGTQTGTEGHTGRHMAHIWDFVLDGELWYYDEDQPFQRKIHKPGDWYHLPPGISQGLSIPSHAWVLEYGRGFIPSILPFGLADAAFSTLDFKTIRRTLGVYARDYPPYLLRLISGRARM